MGWPVAWNWRHAVLSSDAGVLVNWRSKQSIRYFLIDMSSKGYKMICKIFPSAFQDGHHNYMKSIISIIFKVLSPKLELWVLIEYIRWSDVTYLWSQCDRHFVGQHVILCVVKWWRFVVLFESNWITQFEKMSVLSLSYWESDVYWRQNNKHFAELAPQNGGKQSIWRNYVTVTLCISFFLQFLWG